MMKTYTEKIRQAFRFGLIDEEGRKTPCGTLWSDAQRKEFVEAVTAAVHGNKCCATCGHYKRVNRCDGMGVCALINRDRYCLFKCGDWSMR